MEFYFCVLLQTTCQKARKFLQEKGFSFRKEM